MLLFRSYHVMTFLNSLYLCYKRNVNTHVCLYVCFKTENNNFLVHCLLIQIV